MKPSAALAAGLWIGAAAGLLIGAVYFRSVLNRGSESAQSDADLNTQAAKIKALQSERARLDAEMKRLRQTVAEMHRINPSTPSSLATERGSRFNPPTSPATTEPTPPVGPPGEPPSTIRPVDLPPVPEGSD